MHWIDVAMILFSCVAANHLGLVHAVEDVAERKLPIVNCPRCFSFWCVLLYMVFTGHMMITSIATSFLCAALAPWIELLLGLSDIKFNELYDKIYTTTEDEKSKGADFKASS
jgi:hypothetical protein